MRIAVVAVMAVTGAVLLVLGLRPHPHARAGAQSPRNVLAASIRDFHADQIQFLIPRDAIRPINHPIFDTAARSSLGAKELVIGVELHGRARAYPIRVLSAHEIVNDRIGGSPFAVTW
jgi:Protein of unknown function (DUF3179)